MFRCSIQRQLSQKKCICKHSHPQYVYIYSTNTRLILLSLIYFYIGLKITIKPLSGENFVRKKSTFEAPLDVCP